MEDFKKFVSDNVFDDEPLPIPLGIDDYGKKYLVDHLVAAELWDEIEELKEHPIWGEKAKSALQKHNKTNEAEQNPPA